MSATTTSAMPEPDEDKSKRGGKIVYDPQVQAMGAIVDIMEELDGEGRTSIACYLFGRYVNATDVANLSAKE